MRRVTTFLLAAMFSLLLAPPVRAQATLNQTTLSTAINDTTTSVTLASGSTVVVGHYLFMEREQMIVTDITSTPTFLVRRGQNGTLQMAHPANSIVYTGPGGYFRVDDPSGSCVSTSLEVLPRVNARNGVVWNCNNGRWMGMSLVPIEDPSPRVNVTNGSYTIKLTDRIVSLSTTGQGSGGVATAVSTWTLPTVTTALAGKELWIKDESGGVTATTYVALAGTVDGVANSLSATLKTAYGAIGLYAGSNGWFIFSCWRAACWAP